MEVIKRVMDKEIAFNNNKRELKIENKRNHFRDETTNICVSHFNKHEKKGQRENNY